MSLKFMFILLPLFTLATPLSTCMSTAGITTTYPGNSTWASLTTPWQLRFTPSPVAVAQPSTKPQLAACLACALSTSTKVSALAGGHSFVAFGFGNNGNLIVNMAAFTSASYSTTTQLLTVGGGIRVGPAMKYLWDTAGRHFPHVRHGHVGFAGSVTGGGFGSTSRFLGTPMDYLSSVEIMLYNGTIVNAAAGSDLMWAIQGAASSFGVITALTVKTWQPVYPNVISFTLKIANKTLDAGIKSLLAIQSFALTEAPNEFAFRWTLSTAPYSGSGYYYGNPANFDAMILPLKNRLTAVNAQATIAKSQHGFWDQEVIIAPGADSSGGGSSTGRSFYIQALTMTIAQPFTYNLISTLFTATTGSSGRSDLSKSGLIDLWGGIFTTIPDSASSYIHGNNLWLIRLDVNAQSTSVPYPSDGVAWAKAQMLPFENALTSAGIPLRGFANYRDTGLTEAQWSARLYGSGYTRLKALKQAYDPLGMFTANSQSIPIS